MISNLKAGTPRRSAVVNVAGVASVLLYQISNYGNQVGTRSVRVKKIMVQDVAAGGLWFTIGTGAAGAYVAASPSFRTVNNMDGEWSEAEIPFHEYFADIYVQAPGWAVGALNVQIEVEEIG